MKRPDDEIFADALEFSLAERSAFLDRACAGDPAQRARIDALLASHVAANPDFLDQPVVPRPESPEEKIGDRIGAYTLARRLGEGGCGVVYLAEQTDPVRRNVALKIIKLGMDTREVIARFEAERQALAMMDHPGIARVFDAGATATGRPFFVMEFVDGLPITRFCDEHRLTTEQRLDLFARVCLAVQHAHQKGIIHRDVKPSNILVAMHDDTPMPKVIDFGIAKATQGRLAQHTLLTQLDQMIGTPAYMSPEQVEARDLDIDTRSDVYSLGVLLYELLTGRPPYDPQSLLHAGVAEIRRIIREVDPPRPSTRLATLTDADRATIAQARNAAPVQLSSVLRGDLDWIVMRCLEKDRARRYGTASELAEDVRRHLRRETVTARPPDAIYRTRKFISRHRVAVGATAAVATSLVVGTVVSLVQADRARRAETVARAERDAAQAAQRAEAIARTDAQRRQEQAEALLTFMLGDFRAELKKLGKLSLLDAIGDKAMAHFAALDPKDLTDTALNQQARALTQIGETRLDQARYADASKAFETAYQRTAALVTRHPQNADMLFERAQAEFWIGFTARRRGDFALAREWLTRYRNSTAELAKVEGPTQRALVEQSSGEHNLAVLEFDRGNLAAARAGFLAVRVTRRRMLETKPDDTQLRARLADNASWLGRVAESDGRLADALQHYGEMESAIAALAREQNNVAAWQSRLAEAQIFQAQVLAISGRLPAARARFAGALDILQKLTLRDPQNQQTKIASIACRLHYALVLLTTEETRESGELVRTAREQLDALVAAEPSSRIFPSRLLTASMVDARLKLAQGEWDGGLASVVRTLELRESLADQQQDDPWVLRDTGWALVIAGRIHQARGDMAMARKSWQQTVMLLAGATQSRDWRLLDPLAQAHLLLGDRAAARPLIEELKRSGYRAVDPLYASTLEAQ